jgi:hypothetical protein
VLQGVLEKIQFQRLLGDLLLQQRDASLGRCRMVRRWLRRWRILA